MRMRMRKRLGGWGWEVRFTYGTGGDSVYRLASDQSRESEEDDDVAIHFFGYSSDFESKKRKGKERKGKERERKDEE
jgi:hypothetical protein